jgi:hypothetical protein
MYETIRQGGERFESRCSVGWKVSKEIWMAKFQDCQIVGPRGSQLRVDNVA